MWIIFAVLSAFFAGITSILAKCGIKNTDSTVATAVRTCVVLVFAWIPVFITGSQGQLENADCTTLVFLILSGLATGASWLCYFKALQKGPVNKVVPVDKTSTVLTIIMAFIFLNEKISAAGIAGIILISAGTFMMLEKKNAEENESGRGWFVYAAGSAVFASLTSILGKVGIEGIDSNLGTAVRTCVVLAMAWLMVAVTGKMKEVTRIPRNEMLFICFSGFATGASWLCFYRALQEGPASAVVPIDKLNILVTAAFSCMVFHEKLTKKSAAGLVMITAGTIIMALR